MADIHLRNILVKLPSSFNHITIKQFYEEYGEPETASITLRDGSMLPPNPNIPPKAVIPLYLGKEANEFKLQDAHALLSGFGESYHVSEVRRGEDCHTPLAMRPPEARFEPRSPLSYSADIWSLAIAIWEILGMKALFSNEYITEDEMVSEHIDVLGPMPRSWLERWEKRGEFFDDENGRRPKEGREVWPELEDAFQQGVQSYRQKFAIGVFGEEETRAILNLIRQMLAFQPEKRPTIEDVLGSEWMVKWVLPDLERCDRVRSENSN